MRSIVQHFPVLNVEGAKNEPGRNQLNRQEKGAARICRYLGICRSVGFCLHEYSAPSLVGTLEGLAIPNVVCHHKDRARRYVVTSLKRTFHSTQSNATGALPIVHAVTLWSAYLLSCYSTAKS